MADVTKISPDGGTTVYDIKDATAAPITLLEDTVGWTGKNILKNIFSSETQNEVTARTNTDGTISLSGTATNHVFISISDWFDLPKGSYILSGSASSHIYVYIQKESGETIAQCLVTYPDGVSFDYNENAKVRVRLVVENGQNTNDKILYPMLRKASILDPTYEPYHESVEEWGFPRSEQRVLGAKNRLPINFANIKVSNTDGTWSGNVYTLNNVTFTVLTDANGSITGITANGTSSAAADFVVYKDASHNCPFNGYILNGCPDGGSSSTYDLRITDVTTRSNVDHGEGVTVDVTNTGKWQVGILVRNGVTVNNLTFYPMLRLASDPDDTYVPYAMTNRELTEELTVQESEVTDISQGVTAAVNKLKKVGKVVSLTFNSEASSYTDNEVIFTIPSGYRPLNNERYTVWSNGAALLRVNSNGEVIFPSGKTNTYMFISVTWITS